MVARGADRSRSRSFAETRNQSGDRVRVHLITADIAGTQAVDKQIPTMLECPVIGAQYKYCY